MSRAMTALGLSVRSWCLSPNISTKWLHLIPNWWLMTMRTSWHVIPWSLLSTKMPLMVRTMMQEASLDPTAKCSRLIPNTHGTGAKTETCLSVTSNPFGKVTLASNDPAGMRNSSHGIDLPVIFKASQSKVSLSARNTNKSVGEWTSTFWFACISSVGWLESSSLVKEMPPHFLSHLKFLEVNLAFITCRMMSWIFHSRIACKKCHRIENPQPWHEELQ